MRSRADGGDRNGAIRRQRNDHSRAKLPGRVQVRAIDGERSAVVRSG